MRLSSVPLSSCTEKQQTINIIQQIGEKYAKTIKLDEYIQIQNPPFLASCDP